jgi:tetratricopeptide (TPR) repeat protein
VLFSPFSSTALIGINEGDVPTGFLLKDLEGKAVDINDHIGSKPFILVFWKLTENKSFLDYSLEALLFLEDFYEEYNEKSGLEIFGIYTPRQDKEIPDEEVSTVKDLIRMNNITYPVLLDGGFKIFREYGVIALPSMVLVGRGGRINFIYPSFPLAARPLLTVKIKELLGVAEPVKTGETEKRQEATPESARLYHYSLQMYRKGLLEQALSPLKKSLSIDPDFSWAHNLMGMILWERGNFKEAENEFIQAVTLDKRNGPAHFNYGLLLYEKEEYLGSEKHLKNAIVINDALAGAHYILGLLYKDTNRTDESLKELQKALALFEEGRTSAAGYSSDFLRIAVLYTLSGLYQQAGDDKKAFQLLNNAARIAIGFKNGADRKQLTRSIRLMLYE